MIMEIIKIIIDLILIGMVLSVIYFGMKYIIQDLKIDEE
jgi:hypothetical protein